MKRTSTIIALVLSGITIHAQTEQVSLPPNGDTTGVTTTFSPKDNRKENVHELPYFSLSPVPTSGEVTIHTLAFVRRIEVYSASGQLMAVNANKNSIDLSVLESGTYLLKWESNTGTWQTARIVLK